MMTHNWFGTTVVVAALTGAVLAGAEQQPAQGAAGAQDHVAALKQTMQQGLAGIRAYEWIETTVISLKGEEKARKQNRCYYGADGKVQKVPVAPAAAAQQGGGGGGGGRRGGRIAERVVENKKDDMQEYMERAGALIQQYVPPSPERIQAAKDAGRVVVNPPAGGLVRLVISQYLQAGDSVTFDLNPAANRLSGLGVNTYLDTPEDAVTLAVKMNALPDGAIYAAETTLEATAKNIRVVIQNSGHKPMAK
jgi:hypothetical protein